MKGVKTDPESHDDYYSFSMEQSQVLSCGVACELSMVAAIIVCKGLFTYDASTCIAASIVSQNAFYMTLTPALLVFTKCHLHRCTIDTLT